MGALSVHESGSFAIEYRQTVSATMIYDCLPIHDHFRQIDGDRVLGLMDFKGMLQPFFFTLTRD